MPPAESQLHDQLVQEGLRPSRWANMAHFVYGVHDHPYGKVLVVVSGSITLTMNGGTRVVRMQPGDRLALDPRTPHSAVVGPDGVVCLEAHTG